MSDNDHEQSKSAAGGRSGGRDITRLGGVLLFARGNYHSLLSAHGLGTQRFSTQCARLAAELFFTCGHYHSLLGAHGFSTERARLTRALRFARGHYNSSATPRLQHRTCKTSRGHFASLVVPKKVPATYWDCFFLNIPDFET